MPHHNENDQTLAEALRRVLDDWDCAFCDHGILRKRVDGRPAFHADDCPFDNARKLLAKVNQ